ncbi:MAG: hypothetical protein HY820_40210 [Acidobacteria bacterium]|nr:hypothetical protein [Acidobacteriota bacterium]
MSNPLDGVSKQIKSISVKRKKTEADFEEIARLEWFGGLYLSKGEPCLPGEVLEACITRGAMTNKRGKQAKAGMLCLGAFPLQYDGPRDPIELWKVDEFRLVAGVRVGQVRVMRTRPIFRDWSAEIEVRYSAALLNPDEINQFLLVAGELEGLGDWRPRFGRFAVSQL